MSLSSERYDDLPESFDGCDNKQPHRPMFRLKHIHQCDKCPWKKGTNPRFIPRGYDVEKHKALENTIAEPGSLDFLGEKETHVMACHDHHDSYCIGWLANQLGDGNNIGLRLMMRNCSNIRDIQVIGDQHETFQDTLPTDED
jgi:hypothetical protein